MYGLSGTEIPAQKPDTDIQLVYQLIMDRTALKRFGCKSSEIPNLDDLLYAFDKLSTRALQNDIQQLILKKVSHDFRQTFC